MTPAEKIAAERHAEAARVALKVTEAAIVALLAAGAHLDRAAPFITAAVAGLAARNGAHVPENFAAEAVRLGLAVDVLLAKLEGSVDSEPRSRLSPPPLADDELEQLTRPGA